MGKKVFVYALICLVLTTSVSGCNTSPITNEIISDVNSYYVDYAQPEIEYKLYINKKVAPVLGKLIGHATTALNVAKGEFSIEQEINNVRTSIDVITRNKNEFRAMRAAYGYELTRVDIIANMEAAIQCLQDYEAVLRKGNTESIKNHSLKLKSIYSSLQNLTV